VIFDHDQCTFSYLLRNCNKSTFCKHIRPNEIISPLPDTRNISFLSVYVTEMTVWWIHSLKYASTVLPIVKFAQRTQVYHNFTKEKVNVATGRSHMCRGVMTLVTSFSHFTVVLAPASLFSTSLKSLPTRLEKNSL
jgi:hypothetical protein